MASATISSSNSWIKWPLERRFKLRASRSMSTCTRRTLVKLVQAGVVNGSFVEIGTNAPNLQMYAFLIRRGQRAALDREVSRARAN